MIKNNKGITLIEIIVVLAIMGIVVTVVGSIFGFGTKTFKKTTDRGLSQQDERLVVTKVTNALRTARKINTVGDIDLKELNKDVLKVESISFTGDKKVLKIKFKTDLTREEVTFNIRVENEVNMSFSEAERVFYSKE